MKPSEIDITRMYNLGHSISEIAKRLGVSRKNVRKYLIEHGVPIRSYKKAGYMISLKSRWWENKEALAYVIGAILGDGSFNYYGVQLIVKSKEFRDAVASKIKALGLHPVTDCYANMYRLRVFSVSLCKFLRRLKKNPRRLISLLKSDSDIKAFLRGFYEAEGSVYTLKNQNGYPERRLSMTNTKKWLIELIYYYLKQFNYHPWLSSEIIKESKKYAFRVFLTRKDEVKKFISEIKPIIKVGETP